MYNKIIDKIPDKIQRITKFPNNIDETCQIINENDVIISMRYHITLISNILNKNILTIILNKHRHYENKMHWLRDFYKFSDNMINFSSSIPAENVEKLLKNKSNRYSTNEEIEKISKKAYTELESAINIFFL